MVYAARYFKPFSGTQQVIGSGAVTSEKILPGAIDSLQLKDKGVQSADIADGAVLLRHLGPDVPAIGIADGSVTEPKLANDSVSAAKIQTGAVTSTELGAGAVTVLKLGNDAVETVKIKDLNVTNPKVADDTIMPVKLSKSAGFTAEQALVVDTATGKFKSVAMPGAGVQIKVGQFTGNSVSPHAITGVGFLPKAVMIWIAGGSFEAYGPMIKITDDAGGLASVRTPPIMLSQTDGIISLDADGFTVGSTGVNTTGETYSYIALG